MKVYYLLRSPRTKVLGWARPPRRASASLDADTGSGSSFLKVIHYPHFRHASHPISDLRFRLGKHYYVEVIPILNEKQRPWARARGPSVMTEKPGKPLSLRLINLTLELRALDSDLKSQQVSHGPQLREFRQALDSVRTTAWTVNELMDARSAGKDPGIVLSFLTAERLRRFSQMVKDLCQDIDHEGTTWHAQGVQDLADSLAMLQDKLGELVRRRLADAATTQPGGSELSAQPNQMRRPVSGGSDQ